MKNISLAITFSIFFMSINLYSQEETTCQCIGYYTDYPENGSDRIMLTEPFEIPCKTNTGYNPNGTHDGKVLDQRYQHDIEYQVFEHFYNNNKAALDKMRNPNRARPKVDIYIFNKSKSKDEMLKGINVNHNLGIYDEVVWVPNLNYQPLKLFPSSRGERMRKYMKKETPAY